MLRYSIVDGLNQRHPGFSREFWEQVLDTIDILQRPVTPPDDEPVVVDRFATPPMECFAVSPLRNAYGVVGFVNDEQGSLTNALQPHAISPGGLLAPEGYEVHNDAHVAQLCPEIRSFSRRVDEQHRAPRNICSSGSPDKSNRASDEHLPQACTNKLHSSVQLIDDDAPRLENENRDSIKGKTVPRAQGCHCVDQDVAIAQKPATHEEPVSVDNLRASSELSTPGVDARCGSNVGLIEDHGDISQSGQDREFDRRGRANTDKWRSRSNMSRKRPAHALIASQNNTKVSKIKHGHHISLAAVQARFKNVAADMEDATLVSDLLNGIGGPESIDELKHACAAARVPGSYATNDADIACSVKAICELEDEQKRMPMLCRYHWLRVVQWRDRKVDDYLSQGLARKTATTRALTDLMELMYPTTKQGDQIYKRRYQELIQRTSHARHWLELEEMFSIGILAVIPSADSLGCPPFKIAKLKSRTFQILLDLLLEYRGDFLRALSLKLSNVFEILLLKPSTTQYKFESTNEVRNVPRDSDQLLELCTELK